MDDLNKLYMEGREEECLHRGFLPTRLDGDHTRLGFLHAAREALDQAADSRDDVAYRLSCALRREINKEEKKHRRVMCPACKGSKGSGGVHGWEDCRRCGGQGWVFEEKEE